MNEKELYERQTSNEVSLRSSDVVLGRREAALLGWICRHLNADLRESEIRFAELSTGDGQLSRALVRNLPAAMIDCIDISPTRLDYCRRMALTESPSIANRMRFLELNLDIEFGRLERGRYDVVVAIDILEHVFDVFGFVRHCSEILKPHGWLFLRVPNLGYFKRRLSMLCGRLPITSSWFDTPGSFQSWKERYGWDGGHLHFFTIGSLAWLLANEGFRCFSWRDVGARAESFRQIWPGLLLGNLAVSARKLDTPADAPAC